VDNLFNVEYFFIGGLWPFLCVLAVGEALGGRHFCVFQSGFAMPKLATLRQNARCTMGFLPASSAGMYFSAL